MGTKRNNYSVNIRPTCPSISRSLFLSLSVVPTFFVLSEYSRLKGLALHIDGIPFAHQPFMRNCHYYPMDDIVVGGERLDTVTYTVCTI